MRPLFLPRSKTKALLVLPTLGVALLIALLLSASPVYLDDSAGLVEDEAARLAQEDQVEQRVRQEMGATVRAAYMQGLADAAQAAAEEARGVPFVQACLALKGERQ